MDKDGSLVWPSASRLINARWSFGRIGQAYETSTLFFGAAGRLEGHDPWDWVIEDCTLKFLNSSGRVLYIFDRATQNDGVLSLDGHRAGEPQETASFQLNEFKSIERSEIQVEGPEEIAEARPGEPVRLVIWDLDDTFWKGTLLEGGVRVLPSNIEIVKTLTDRGVINSVCSKNDFNQARDRLIEFGVWNYFVFPQIAFVPKGAMVRSIVRQSQLRASSVLLIDDLDLNLHEAQHYVPGLQVARPTLLPELLSDRRLKGKADLNHSRLKRYRVLEAKLSAQVQEGGDNIAFLRQSSICISIHSDVYAQFDRIHELVNRTNQMNFTKNRWPENRAEAERVFAAELERHFNSRSGYIKVSDRYGDYGICGFFLTNAFKAHHFLFSCRAMNMGIEQFLWTYLARPRVRISGEVVSDLATPVDWITLVENAEQSHPGDYEEHVKICLRGACDLEQSAHYMHGCGKFLHEHQFLYRGWAIHSVARAIALARELERPDVKALLAKMPGMPAKRFDSAVLTGEADHYIFAFSQEFMCGLYRSRSTGIVLPLHFAATGRRDFNEVTFEEVTKKNPDAITESQWQFLLSEFEYLGSFDKALLQADLDEMFSRLKGKHVIIVNLNTRFGRRISLLKTFASINETVQSVAERAVREYRFDLDFIDTDEFLMGEQDLAQDNDFAGSHFTRDIYRRLSVRMRDLMTAHRERVRSRGRVAAAMLAV